MDCIADTQAARPLAGDSASGIGGGTAGAGAEVGAAAVGAALGGACSEAQPARSSSAARAARPPLECGTLTGWAGSRGVMTVPSRQTKGATAALRVVPAPLSRLVSPAALAVAQTIPPAPQAREGLPPAPPLRR
jgi:hypothetical protein